MDVNQRFLEVMKQSGLNKGEFAIRLGVSQGVISHISSGRNKPGLELIVAVLEQFPRIQPDWLLLGKGPMEREDSLKTNREELLKLLEEVKLLNQMNYNGLLSRIESLEKRISEG